MSISAHTTIVEFLVAQETRMNNGFAQELEKFKRENHRLFEQIREQIGVLGNKYVALRSRIEIIERKLDNRDN